MNSALDCACASKWGCTGSPVGWVRNEDSASTAWALKTTFVSGGCSCVIGLKPGRRPPRNTLDEQK